MNIPNIPTLFCHVFKGKPFFDLRHVMKEELNLSKGINFKNRLGQYGF